MIGPFDVGLGFEVHRGTWSNENDVYLHLPVIVREDLSFVANLERYTLV